MWGSNPFLVVEELDAEGPQKENNKVGCFQVATLEPSHQHVHAFKRKK
jgi:hypothetical protein